MNKEVWKKIPGFDAYSVSSLGRVKSSTQILKFEISHNGYYRVTLFNNGKRSKKFVHRLVMLAFKGPCPEGMEVNHKKGIKTDNRFCKLEYISRSNNHKHAYRLGLMKAKGSDNGQSLLTEQEVLEIRAQIIFNGRFYGQKDVAKKYGVSVGCISDIIHRRRWTHL